MFPGDEVELELGGWSKWLVYEYASVFQMQNAFLIALAVFISLMCVGSEFQIRIL